MKKTALIILFAILMLFFAGSALASDTYYDVAEFDFRLKLPDDWFNFTRNIKDGDPNLKKLGLEKERLLSQYLQNSVYLNSIRMEPLSEIVVTVIRHKDYEEIHNMSLLSLEQINVLGDYMTGGGAEESSQYYGYSTYSKNGMTYLVLDLRQEIDGQDAYSKQYSTVVNGDLISIILRNYEGDISSDDEMLIKDIADTLTFGHIYEKEQSFFNKFASFKTVGYTLVIAAAVVFILVIIINNGGAKKTKKKKKR